MFYIASKLTEQFLIPSNFLLLLGLLGIVCLVLRWRRSGVFFTTAAIVLLGICGWLPIGAMALSPLENRFPHPEITAAPTGIIVLGGSTDIHLTADRKMLAINEAGERLTETVALARLYPGARIFLSGGTGHLHNGDGEQSESAGTRDLLLRLGVPAEQISMEEQSRTTLENAEESKKALQPKAGETWLLVTSAWHMPRSVASFRAAGFDVIPYPVDYRTLTKGQRIINKSAADGLEDIDLAFHEWIGLASYKMAGKTAEFFPKP